MKKLLLATALAIGLNGGMPIKAWDIKDDSDNFIGIGLVAENGLAKWPGRLVIQNVNQGGLIEYSHTGGPWESKGARLKQMALVERDGKTYLTGYNEGKEYWWDGKKWYEGELPQVVPNPTTLTAPQGLAKLKGSIEIKNGEFGTVEYRKAGGTWINTGGALSLMKLVEKNGEKYLTGQNPAGVHYWWDGETWHEGTLSN